MQANLAKLDEIKLNIFFLILQQEQYNRNFYIWNPFEKGFMFLGLGIRPSQGNIEQNHRKVRLRENKYIHRK